MLLLRNKDQKYNNPIASFATCPCRQRIGHERTAQLCYAFREPRVYLSGPVYMPGGIHPEVRLPLDQRLLCSDCKKCSLLCLAQV